MLCCAVDCPSRGDTRFCFCHCESSFHYSCAQGSVSLLGLAEAVTNSLKVEMKDIKNHTWLFQLPRKGAPALYPVREGCCKDLCAESGESVLKRQTSDTFPKQCSRNHLAVGGATTAWYLRPLTVTQVSVRVSILFLGTTRD